MEPIISLPVEETITNLGNSDQPLRNSRLAELSNLKSSELELCKQVWGSIELKRRRQIMCRLVELAEDNFELDFNSIFRYCLKDQDAEVRGKAIEGLWECEDTSLIHHFTELLEQDSSESVQEVAAMALSKFAMLAELGKLRLSHATQVCQALLDVMSDKSRVVEVRRRALEAAAPLSLSQVERAIMEAYHSHNRKLKTSAIYAMGKNYNGSWFSILLRELSNSDAEIRYEAAGACGELGEEEAVPYLVELIGDLDVDVQVAALQALGKIGCSDAKECLWQCLNSPSEVIRQAAEEALYGLEVEENPFTFSV